MGPWQTRGGVWLAAGHFCLDEYGRACLFNGLCGHPVKVTGPCSTNAHGQLLSQARVIGGPQPENRKHYTINYDGGLR
jgi:hypothetical protein